MDFVEALRFDNEAGPRHAAAAGSCFRQDGEVRAPRLLVVQRERGSDGSRSTHGWG
jgi:hypothetical protein